MKRYECPDHIYKFLSYNGLLRTLESTTFRLSRPADFNDPLDAYLQEAFGKDRKFFLEGLKAAFIDFIEGENDPSSLPDSPWKAQIMLIHAARENAPPDHRVQLRKEILSIPIENLYDLDRFRTIFPSCARFSSARRRTVNRRADIGENIADGCCDVVDTATHTSAIKPIQQCVFKQILTTNRNTASSCHSP